MAGLKKGISGIKPYVVCTIKHQKFIAMKKVFLNAGLSLAVLFLSTVTLWAQPHGHHPGIKGNPFSAIEELENELQLTPEQKEAIESLQQEVRTAHQGRRKESRKVRKAQAEQRKAMHESVKAKLDDILTAEQTALLEAQHEAKKAEAKAMRDKMRAYKEENIAPVLLEQRKKLEVKISEADKATLAKIRTEGQQMRKEKRQGQKAKPRPNKEELSALIEKYSEDIDALMEEIAAQQEQWKKDMKAIAGEGGQSKGKRQKRMKKGHQQRKPGFQKARFLLMDPVKGSEIDNNNRY